jgi:aminoglycoside phosphotransferase (APT) family kinase protein
MDDATAQLVDAGRLAAWLDARDLEAGAAIALHHLTGGQSNEMFVVERGGSRWVLRRPSGVALPRADEGLRREFRILTALEQTVVPHPAPVIHCDDPGVIGATFYLMAAVDGFRPDREALAVRDLDDAARRELALAMVDALAELHLVDHVALGLADLGRVDDFHERQVARWMKQLHSYGGRELPGVHRLASWLEANRPSSFRPTMMHADYHLMNVIVSEARPFRVAAIVDWETATIGDPLLDLAAFLRNSFSTPGTGWPAWDELIARYSQRTAIEVPDLTYYVHLSRFRLAVLLEGVYQRSLADPTRPVREEAGRYAVSLVEESVAGLGGAPGR